MKRTQLIAARTKMHRTQQQIATILGVDADTVSRWEQGKTLPRGYHIEELCQLYGLSEAELGLQESVGYEAHCVIIEQPTGVAMKELFSSIQRDLTTLLMNIVVSWPRRDHNYHVLQSQINDTIDQYNKFVEEDDDYVLTRRSALRSLAQLPIAFCGIGLVAGASPVKKSADETLAYVAAGIAACWHFRKGKDLSLAYDAISLYIPVLGNIASSSGEQHRKAAASLLVQSYLLKASLAIHVDSDEQAILCHKEALRFAQIAENPLLQAVAWRMLMTTHNYASRWDQALVAAERARGIIEGSKDIPAGIASFVYSGLSLSQARQGQADAAMASLKQAHKTFDHNTSPPIWVQYNLPILVDCDGLTHSHVGHYKQAIDSFAQVPALPGVSAVGKVEAVLDQAEAEIRRDDQPRDIEQVISLWTQGMHGAKELKSEQRYSEARNVLQLMFVAWPGEPRVKELRDLATHW